MELTTEAVREIAPGLARAIVAEACGLRPRPASGLAAALSEARREIESLLRGFGYLDLVLRGRASSQFRELVLRADSLLPRACFGCGAPVWYLPHGTSVVRCQQCWQLFVHGARLAARAQTESEVQAGLRMAFPNLDL